MMRIDMVRDQRKIGALGFADGAWNVTEDAYDFLSIAALLMSTRGLVVLHSIKVAIESRGLMIPMQDHRKIDQTGPG